jgi:hypothetical protein
VEKYWGDDRTYHHAAPISMNYALREALRLLEEEGLENRWYRRRRNQPESFARQDLFRRRCRRESLRGESVAGRLNWHTLCTNR